MATACENMHRNTTEFLYLNAWPGIVTSAVVICTVFGVWPNTIVRGSQGEERVFGLGRIIHSPLKRIGESHRLWWVVSWCLFHITRTGMFVSQAGPSCTTTMSPTASWVIVIVLLTGGKGGGGGGALSCHRSQGLERWCDNWHECSSANEHPLSSAFYKLCRNTQSSVIIHRWMFVYEGEEIRRESRCMRKSLQAYIPVYAAPLRCADIISLFTLALKDPGPPWWVRHGVSVILHFPAFNLKTAQTGLNIKTLTLKL